MGKRKLQIDFCVFYIYMPFEGKPICIEHHFHDKKKKYFYMKIRKMKISLNVFPYFILLDLFYQVPTFFRLI